MKKIITTLALASFGVAAFAQSETAQPVAANESNFLLGAKFAFESEFISAGQEHSDENIQTSLSLEYLIPSSGDFAFSVYSDVFYMSPLTQTYNQASIAIGGKSVWLEEYAIDFGYRFTGFPNCSNGGRYDRAYEMNDAPVNRKNELYFGLSRDIEFVDNADWSHVLLSGYVTYNWNCEQLTWEFAASKVFDKVGVDELSIATKVAYGYVDSRRWNGDQRDAGDPRAQNSYGYVALSADAIYSINQSTDVSVGIRYAYNNDGEHGTNTENNLWWGAAISFRY